MTNNSVEMYLELLKARGHGRPLVAARTQPRVPTKIAKEIEEKATRIVIMHSRHDPLSLSFLFERSSHFSSPNRHLFPVPDRL